MGPDVVMALGLAAAGAQVIGGVTSAAGQMRAGNQADINARIEAKQLNQQAGQERAAAIREANNRRREKRITQSNLQAAAAASGGGADDPTVVALDSQLEREGGYNALTALYEGEERARGLEFDADMRKKRGKDARRASRWGAAGSFLSGAASGASLAAKYGAT